MSTSIKISKHIQIIFFANRKSGSFGIAAIVYFTIIELKNFYLKEKYKTLFENQREEVLTCEPLLFFYTVHLLYDFVC